MWEPGRPRWPGLDVSSGRVRRPEGRRHSAGAVHQHREGRQYAGGIPAGRHFAAGWGVRARPRTVAVGSRVSSLIGFPRILGRDAVSPAGRPPLGRRPVLRIPRNVKEADPLT